MNRELAVLLVDDEPEILYGERTVLQSQEFREIITISNGNKVMSVLSEKDVAVIVLDLSMPGISGEDILKEINLDFPHIPVIIMTANNEIETAVECMKNGAFDYLVKPLEKNKFVSVVRKAVEMFYLRREVSLLKNHLLDGRLKDPSAFSSIISNSKKMFAIFNYIDAIAQSPQPVLVTGETGVGKELFAKVIHSLSDRNGNFIAVNVAGLDDTMFSDTLFGHKKGAYTGADDTREGLIAQAANGSLFLDEIGDMQESSQVKLLRLLQEHTYYPLGSDVPKHSNARIIVATNHNLQERMNEKKFRKDLFFRLRTHNIGIPPLRDRSEDIPLLLNHFIEHAARSLSKKKPAVPPQLYTLLSTYSFPGNIRELQAMVYDAVARNKAGILSMDSFKEALGQKQAPHNNALPSSSPKGPDLRISFPERFPTIKEAEEFLVSEALKLAGGNQGIAASMLGLTRQALNKRLTRKEKIN